MQQNTPRCAAQHIAPTRADCEKKVLSATPCHATQCENQVKNFRADSALWHIARSHLYLQISLRICNHTQTLFNPLISDPCGFD
jgi:hypothetical protein